MTVEEQFYLLWPLALLMLRERRALIFAVAAVFIGPLVRVSTSEYVVHIDPHSALANAAIFPAMCDYLATGCALALLRPWLLTQHWYLRVTASRWLLLAVPMAFAINRFDGFMALMLFGSPILSLCLALLIESCTRHTQTLAGRFLNWRPVAALGVLSYSLYLWEQPFIDRHSGAWVNAFPQNLLLGFVAALLSYFVVERAFLGLRKRLRRAKPAPDRLVDGAPMTAGEADAPGSLPPAA